MNLNLCVVLLVLQIIGYIFCFKKNIKWMWLCQMVFHTLCVAYPITLNFYLNQNAVSGLEALAGLAEVLLGLMILAVFGFTWLVSVITVLVKWRRMLGEAGKKEALS